MRAVAILTFIFLAFNTFSQRQSQAIRALMASQQEAWNKADLEGFMKHYWNNDSLMFIGSKGVTYGWQQTLDNYKKAYPGPEKMGVLQFDILKTEVISKSTVYVIGKWTLSRTENNIGGYFTLLWKKIKGNWMIVADHTS